MGLLTPFGGSGVDGSGQIDLIGGMRIQTLFGRIAGATHEGWFGFGLVFLRIAFGLELFMLGRELFQFTRDGLLAQEQVLAPLFRALMTVQNITSLTALTLITIGILFVIGLAVRPVGVVLLLLIIILDLFFLPGTVVSDMIFLQGVAAAMSILALSGGLGHAFGLNGIIFRNIKRPGTIAKILFV